MEVNTRMRLRRAATPFAVLDAAERRLASPPSRRPAVIRVGPGPWQEGSHGDPMHKLVFVVAGAIDVEGTHGGWLVPRAHMIFIPKERPFNLRAGRRTELLVAHLDSRVCAWPRPGCWVGPADGEARVLLRYPLRWAAGEGGTAAKLFVRTLSAVCVDWFAQPRMLHVPAADSPETAALLRHLAVRLGDATLAGACAATGLGARTLQRRCRDTFAMSWRALVREARMMRALELLLAGHGRPGEIGRAVGFDSDAAFSSAFAGRFGASPRVYLRRCAAAAEP